MLRSSFWREPLLRIWKFLFAARGKMLKVELERVLVRKQLPLLLRLQKKLARMEQAQIPCAELEAGVEECSLA